MLTWDDKKNVSNQAKHGLSFEAVHDYDWSDPFIMDRSRHADSEFRYATVGMLYGKLHTIILGLQ